MRRSKRLFLLLLLTIGVIAAISICASATEMKTGIGVVESSGLRLRAKPNTDADIISTAS